MYGYLLILLFFVSHRFYRFAQMIFLTYTDTDNIAGVKQQ